MQKELSTKVLELLKQAEQASQLGQREKAYLVSLEATALAPQEPFAWYLRSQAAASPEEQLMCLSRAYSLDPAFPDAKKELHLAVRALLKQEPFLAYVHETEVLYQVRSGRDMLINIPKNRTYEKPYLQKSPGIAAPAFRWLMVSLLALLLGGVGAVLLAPITAFQVLRLQATSPVRGDRIRLWVVFILAVLIWLAAIPISWLLLIRFYP